jgi:O-antigen/teichoic acid export membrane protein
MSIDKKIFYNSAWMMLEKFLGIFGLIFVNSYMAKYIGPESFGKLAFAMSIFVFVQTFSWFGAENVLFKRLSENVNSGVKLSLASQYLRRVLFVISSIGCLLYLWLSADTLTFIFGLGNCIASYFIVSDIYSIYNNSQLASYVNALTNILGLSLALILRFMLVFFEAEHYSMVFPIIVIALVPYMIRKWYFQYVGKHSSKIKVSKKYNKYMLMTGGSLVLSTLSITLYTQISNIFLAEYTSFSSLGIYNVALMIGGAWGFISIALITSYFSKIYSTKSNGEEIQLLRQIHLIAVGVGMGCLLAVSLIGKWFIELLYGSDYIKAASFLPLIVIGTILSTLGTISYRYMIKYSGYKYLSIKMFIVSLLSVPLSYFLIKAYGAMGAAVCFIIIEFLSLTVGNYFFRKGLVLKVHLSIFKLNNRNPI